MTATETRIQHTPGPWAVEGESGNPSESYAIVADHRIIAWTSDSTATDNEGDRFGGIITAEDGANARLIAAAPQLLRALQYALPYLGSHPSDGNQICSVIVRAQEAIDDATTE